MTVANDKPLFILVDDDPINNSISRLTIMNTVSHADVTIFNDPNSGLNFLIGDFIDHPATSVILLLNLNMPSMSGWEFLDRFEALKGEAHHRIRTYILSSSINPLDRKRSEQTANITGFLAKPLSTATILEMLSLS